MNKLSHPNRNKSKSPKRNGRYWCACDFAMVGKGEKCPHCGQIDSKSKRRVYKKQNRYIEEDLE